LPPSDEGSLATRPRLKEGGVSPNVTIFGRKGRIEQSRELLTIQFRPEIEIRMSEMDE
jgi:hypothetical protein